MPDDPSRGRSRRLVRPSGHGFPLDASSLACLPPSALQKSEGLAERRPLTASSPPTPHPPGTRSTARHAVARCGHGASPTGPGPEGEKSRWARRRSARLRIPSSLPLSPKRSSTPNSSTTHRADSCWQGIASAVISVRGGGFTARQRREAEDLFPLVDGDLLERHAQVVRHRREELQRLAVAPPGLAQGLAIHRPPCDGRGLLLPQPRAEDGRELAHLAGGEDTAEGGVAGRAWRFGLFVSQPSRVWRGRRRP